MSLQYSPMVRQSFLASRAIEGISAIFRPSLDPTQKTLIVAAVQAKELLVAVLNR